jgi:hypothetical protein
LGFITVKEGLGFQQPARNIHQLKMVVGFEIVKGITILKYQNKALRLLPIAIGTG